MNPTVIRLLRLKVKATQEEFAGMMKIHAVTLARWESGSLAPDSVSRADLVRVAKDHSIDLEGLDAVLTITQLLEEYDSGTSGHSKRVSRLAELVARRMGEDAFSAALAGLFHDVGKVNLPRSVLERRGKLTPEERLLLQSHVRGGEVLSRLVAGEVVARAVSEHHERLNGNGYPRGISGGEISILGRILAASDELDARTWKRGYRRKEETPLEVLSLMEQDSGFDPLVVKALRAVVRDEVRRKEPVAIVPAAA